MSRPRHGPVATCMTLTIPSWSLPECFRGLAGSSPSNLRPNTCTGLTQLFVLILFEMAQIKAKWSQQRL